LAMLDFAARDYLEICYRFGRLVEEGKPHEPDVVRYLWTNLIKETKRLGLPVTREHILCLFDDLARENPTKGTYDRDEFAFSGATLNLDRLQHHVEAIYNTLRAELDSMLFKAIPRERALYCAPKWLEDTSIPNKLGDTIEEFHKAGRCFAYSENTACIFHLMRVVDFCLRKVCESLGETYDARNWHGIADAITKKMETKYKQKTDDWKKQERFYAEILTDIQALSRGHRNPSLHELEKQYDEREARYLITVVEGFARHVAEKL